MTGAQTCCWEGSSPSSRDEETDGILDQGGAAVVGKNAGRDHFLVFILHWR